MKKYVSVVIPAVKYDLSLQRCLNSIVEQKDVELDCWVVFNPTIPSDFNRGTWPSWIRFLACPKGVNRARNKGIGRSAQKTILFLDADCVMTDPKHIWKMANFIDRNPEAMGVGGFYEIPPNANAVTRAYHVLQTNWLFEQILDEQGRSRGLIGGHMMLRKNQNPALKFDERIQFGGSEKEFFLRCEKHSAVFYLKKEFSVLHISEISEAELINKAKAQGRGQKYIRSLGYMEKRKGSIYLERKEYDKDALPAAEKYRKYFSKYSGDKADRRNNFLQTGIFKLLKRMNLASKSIE